MKNEVNNILNILFVCGIMYVIITVVGGMILIDVESGDYTLIVVIILVLLGGWSGFWEDPRPPKE